MFERQTRSPFPVTQIFLLGMVILAFMIYIIKNMERPMPPAPPPVGIEHAGDSVRMEVQLDSLAR